MCTNPIIVTTGLSDPVLKKIILNRTCPLKTLIHLVELTDIIKFLLLLYANKQNLGIVRIGRFTRNRGSKGGTTLYKIMYDELGLIYQGEDVPD